MKVILSNHAKKRIGERGISIQEVYDTLEIPDYVVSKISKKEAHKKIGEKILKVVYTEEDKYLKVVTLMWK